MEIHPSVPCCRLFHVEIRYMPRACHCEGKSGLLTQVSIEEEVADYDLCCDGHEEHSSTLQVLQDPNRPKRQNETLHVNTCHPEDGEGEVMGCVEIGCEEQLLESCFEAPIDLIQVNLQEEWPLSNIFAD